MGVDIATVAYDLSDQLDHVVAAINRDDVAKNMYICIDDRTLFYEISIR